MNYKKICEDSFKESKLSFNDLQKVTEIAKIAAKKGGDFCLMSKKVVKNLNSLSEKNLFIRGLRSFCSGIRSVKVIFILPVLLC